MDNLIKAEVNKQLNMNNTWYESLIERFGEDGAVEYSKQRYLIYKKKWEKAIKFFGPNQNILDIGGGTMSQENMDFISQNAYSYTLQDIDQASLESAIIRAATSNFQDIKTVNSINTILPFADNSFDCIFSSHCLEHSADLAKTLFELNRVLINEKGKIYISVPFGFDPNKCHPYILEVEDYLKLISCFGFEIINSYVSNEYPEDGYELTIEAKKTTNVSEEFIEIYREKLNFYNKNSAKIISCQNNDKVTIQSSGEITKVINLPFNAENEIGGIILKEKAYIRLKKDSSFKRYVPIIYKHKWSGDIQIYNQDESINKTNISTISCFSPFHYISCSFGIYPASQDLIIEKTYNKLSIPGLASELILLGFLAFK